MVQVRYMHRMTSRDMMRLAPHSIMQLVDKLHFYRSSSSKTVIVVTVTIFVIVTYGHKPPFLGTTCMLVRGDLNLQYPPITITPTHHGLSKGVLKSWIVD